MPGKFSEVIDDYISFLDAEDRLAESTKGNWKRALLLASRSMGSLDIEVVRPALVQAHLDGLADFPGKQSVAQAAIRSLEKWAIVRDKLQSSITIGTRIIGSDGGHDPWTEDQIATAIKSARKDLSRVVSLAINTGQRGSDIVKMRWSDIVTYDERQGVNVIQQKTGRQLWIPLTTEFSAEIATWERRPPFFLILAPDGKPFNRTRLSHDWTYERNDNPALASHKQSGLVLHGLRASTVIRLRKMGFTELEIASYIGMSPQMVARYSRHANQQKMALASVERLENFRADNIRRLREKGK